MFLRGGTDLIPSEYVEYQETLGCYLSTYEMNFTYEAATDDTSEEAVAAAALELGRMYMDELCSKGYSEIMEEPYISPMSYYSLVEYQDLQVETLENSLDRTLEKLAKQHAEPGAYMKAHSDVPADCFLVDDMTSWYPRASENVWVVSYSATVLLENAPSSLFYLDGWGYVTNSDARIKLRKFLLIQEGKQFTLIPCNNIVKKDDILFE